MSAEVIEVATCRYKVAVTVPAVEVTQRFDKAYREVSSQVAIKGFRKGHVPSAVLRRRYGKEIGEDVTYKMFEETFTEALKGKDLYALGAPEIEITTLSAEPNKDFVYATEVDVRPKFDLPAYSEIKLTTTSEAITPEKINERIEKIWERVAPYDDVEESAQAKDAIEISGVINIDGKESEKLTNHFLEMISAETGLSIIKGIVIADVVKSFAGVKKGDEKKISVEVNDQYREPNLAGKTAKLVAHIDNVKRKSALSMERLSQIFGVSDEVKLRENLTKALEDEMKMQDYHQHREQVITQLVEKSKFDLPADYVKRQMEQMIKRREEMKKAGGENATTENDDDWREKTTKETEEAIRRIIILDTIATQENIGIAEDDVARYVENFSRKHQIPPMEFYKMLRNPPIAARITEEIITEKTLFFLVDKVKAAAI